RWQMVAQSWEKALAAKPGKIADWSQLGEALLVLERYEQARDALLEADRVGPSEPRLKFIRTVGARLYTLKRKLKKKTLAEKLVGGTTRRLVDALRGKQSLETWDRLGRCYAYLGDNEKSRHYYAKAVQNSFARSVEYGGVGALHARQNNWQDAIFAYQRRFKEYPQLCELPLKIGHIHRRLGWFDEAENSYREALEAGADKARCFY